MLLSHLETMWTGDNAVWVGGVREAGGWNGNDWAGGGEGTSYVIEITTIKWREDRQGLEEFVLMCKYKIRGNL